MKQIKSLSYYLTSPIDINGCQAQALIPLGSKILNISIDTNMLNILVESNTNTINHNTESIKFIAVSDPSIKTNTFDIEEDYIYVNSVTDSNPSISSTTYSSSNVQLNISTSKITYHVFRQMTMQEKRDNKIEQIIIDKK